MDDETASLTHGLSCCDEHAWRAFHEQYYQQLHNLARARGVSDCDVPEIVQGVYLRVLRHAKVIRDAESFKAWLACLVRCEVIDHARRKGRRSWLNERFQQWQEARRESSDCGVGDQLDEAMRSLGENDRALIRRHYLDGWSQQKLAEHQQTSVKAVESKLARLRKRLRQNLENPATDTT
jgi:RNA polymerase sigma-70 factor (ECF subfamily)